MLDVDLCQRAAAFASWKLVDACQVVAILVSDRIIASKRSSPAWRLDAQAAQAAAVVERSRAYAHYWPARQTRYVSWDTEITSGLQAVPIPHTPLPPIV